MSALAARACRLALAPPIYTPHRRGPFFGRNGRNSQNAVCRGWRIHWYALAPNATYPANFQETHHAPILSQAQALHGACAGPDRHYLFAEFRRRWFLWLRSRRV